jgi:type 1 fimbriae regulatory protein FimB
MKEAEKQVATLTVIHRPNAARRAERSPMAFMTYEELLRVLRVARQRSTRDWCMLLLAYRHGLRTTEVCALELQNVATGVLFVRRLKGSRSTTQPLYPHPVEPLLDEVEALREWLRVRREDGSRALFTSQKGGAIHRSQFFRIFQSVAMEAGLASAKRHPRILKYSLASHLLATGAAVNRVSEFLGHRSHISTWQYAKAARRAELNSEVQNRSRSSRRAVAYSGSSEGAGSRPRH